MKKLILFVIITALSVAVASAQSRGVIGDYAMIANGNCLHSSCGFDTTTHVPTASCGTPSAPSKIWGATTTAQAFWTFKPNGTGSVEDGVLYAIDFPPGYENGDPATRNLNFNFDFTYEVMPDGDITITPTADYSYFPVLEGNISSDRKTITIVSMDKLGGSPKGPAVCNTARVLTKLP
jgi:hypothetical protein